MLKPLKKDYSYYGYDYEITPQRKLHSVQKRKKVKAKKKTHPIAALIGLLILGAYGYYVCPFVYEKYFRPIVLNPILNRNLKLDISKYTTPTLSYANNSFLLDRDLLVEPNFEENNVVDIKIVSELTGTKEKLLELFKKYPNLNPSVYVWEYSTGSGLEINSNKVYPSASIIKIPIAFELIRLVDSTSKSKNPIKLENRKMFTEQFRTLGSGDLQKTKANVLYTLDYLANIMIANSDNSATNMVLHEIGGVDGFNRAMRNAGLKVTSMGQWLPDLEGYNKTTAYEVSKILYNIDNPKYINPKYKNILKEYLGNTRNIHLIKEKLPQDVMVLHKTGDIGTMLGDSGIVYTNDGKKYIVSILVERPHNDYGAKMLIQEASLLIFNDIKTLL